MTERIDVALVSRGLAKSRQRAQRLIAAGMVTLNGAAVEKPSQKVGDSDALALTGSDIPYVGRGGLKLARALDAFRVDPSGQVCVDIGASTGGFTDVLLRCGATRVYAVDVGRAQLDPSLMADPRVVSMEGVNARGLTAGMFPEPIRLGVMDVSFISIRLILPAVFDVLGPDGRLVALVKPQFEVGRERIGKGGIVSDPAARAETLTGVAAFVQNFGWRAAAVIPSPIRGGSGNVEFLADLMPAERCAQGIGAADIEAAVRAAPSN